MGTINPAIPTIGQPNSTEDSDVRSGMITIRDEINGNLDNDNIKTAANIAGSKLAANSVAASKIVNATGGQILLANSSGVITPTTISGDVTVNNSGVTTIGTDAVSTSEIADNSITHLKMADNSVGNDELRDNAVNTTELVDDAVTSAKLSDSASTDANRAVGTDHIKDSAVTNAKLGSSSVTNGKLSYTTINNDVTTDQLLTTDTQYIHNMLSVPAGTWMLNHHSTIRTGTASNFGTIVIDITWQGGSKSYELDPVPGTTASNERFSFGWSQVITTTSSGNVRFSYKALNSTGGAVSGVYLIYSNLAGFCIQQ